MTKKLVLCIPSLSKGGGAERVFQILANNLSREAFDVYVLTVTEPKGQTLTTVDDVKYRTCRKARVFHALPSLIRELKAIDPDIVLSTSMHLNSVMMILEKLFFKRVTFVYRETIFLGDHLQAMEPSISNIIIKLIYKWGRNKHTRLIAQSKIMQADIIKRYAVSSDSVAQIYNPVEPPTDTMPSCDMPKRDSQKTLILSAGRLEHQKDFQLLILAMAHLDESFELWIIGEGSKRNELEALIQNEKLSDRVKLLGQQPSIAPYLKQCSYFALPSYYEGFPNVVIEALSYGVPCVTMNFAGADELITATNGIICTHRSPESFAKSITQLSETTFDASTIQSDTHATFGVETICKQYEQTLLSFYQKKSSCCQESHPES